MTTTTDLDRLDKAERRRRPVGNLGEPVDDPARRETAARRAA